MINTISKELGNHLKSRLKANNVSEYKVYTHYKICSRSTLSKILNGECDNVIPLDKIINIYKVIGENEINIQTDNFKLYIKLNFK